MREGAAGRQFLLDCSSSRNGDQNPAEITPTKSARFVEKEVWARLLDSRGRRVRWGGAYPAMWTSVPDPEPTHDHCNSSGRGRWLQVGNPAAGLSILRGECLCSAEGKFPVTEH